MKTINISISDNRVSIELPNGKNAQFVIWDLEETKHNDLENQIKTGLSIASSLSDLEKHLQINGFDAHLEDIY